MGAAFENPQGMDWDLPSLHKVKKHATIQISAIAAKINLSSTRKSIASAIPRTSKKRQYQRLRGARFTGLGWPVGRE